MNVTDKIEITCEDNMELMARYPDNHFDLAIVDPPYFSGPEKRGFYGRKNSQIGVKRVDYEINEKSWQLPEKEYYNELIRVSKNQIIWGINYFVFANEVSGRIVWDKVNGDTSFSDCEIASSSFHDSVRIFAYMWNGMLQGKSTKEGRITQGNKSLNEKRIHPTQKPVKLYEFLLARYAEKGIKILDTHYGSGSLGIACHNFECELTACELDPKCYSSAVNRLQNHISQIRMF